MKGLAEERTKTFNTAVRELRTYWKKYGEAPPGGGQSQQSQPRPDPPRPEPKPEPKPEPPPNTNRGNEASGSPAFDHANYLAMNGGYRGDGSYRERLLDPVLSIELDRVCRYLEQIRD